MHAPMSFFETTVSTPLPFRWFRTHICQCVVAVGQNHESIFERCDCYLTSFRCTTQLKKTDIDTIDNLLGDALRMFASTLSQILGAVVLISVSAFLSFVTSFYTEALV